MNRSVKINKPQNSVLRKFQPTLQLFPPMARSAPMPAKAAMPRSGAMNLQNTGKDQGTCKQIFA